MDLQERVLLKKADRQELYSLEPPFPKTNFLMELSNACNHACIFCAHQKMQRKIGRMDKNLAFHILQQAYDLGTREVGFYATGEPFLVHDLADYIRKAKEIGYTYVYLTSNGSLATPEKIRAVIDSGLDSIKFSINAPERRMYAFIHGRDDFEVVKEHLAYVNQYRRDSGRNFKIYITGILTRYTEHMREQYFQVFSGMADQIVFKTVYNQGGYMPEIDTMLKCDCDHETYRRCNLPFDAVSVTYEGYLSIENADYENMLIVADLNQVSLKEGWYGKKMKEMRRRFMENDLGGTLCDGCVNHALRPAKQLSPEYAQMEEYIFDDTLVRRRLEAAGYKLEKAGVIQEKGLVYVPMAADILHPGHINIIKAAASYGKVLVGLLTDEAVASYKRVPYLNFEQRKAVVENIKGVYMVTAQDSRDYEKNLRKYQPAYMVHGTDWREGTLADVRKKAIAVMQEWGGQVIEPEYTKGVSSTAIQEKIRNRENR